MLPLFTDKSAQLLYDRGNSYLKHNEYDKAESIFAQLLSLCPDDPEIYWDLVLCKYGVSFVKDPSSGKYIPTCNRTHFQSVFQDENYLTAIKHSDDEKAAFYKTNAETIDKIQKGIMSVAKHEKPFDIFISYKETDSNGSRTEDSVRAQRLYDLLTEAGYKVFFSRITLEDKAGTEYEPYIYSALYSSKVMLTVCSNRENIESPWVKNEWSRYLTMCQSDSGKALIPLYYNMQRSELPDEFAVLSAHDISKDDFEQELLRGIKKLIPLPIMLAQRRKKLKKRLGISAAVIAVIIVIAGIIAFPKIKSYVDNNDKYNTAMELYNSEKYSEAADAFAEIEDFKDAAAMKTDSERMIEYSSAMQLYYDGNYPEAAWAFAEMNGYKDSADKQKDAELKWREKVATVATKNLMGSSSAGAYYISANGTVEAFDDDPGTANENITINEHGKIVSINDNYKLYALHEDGYVTNAKTNNRMDADWENIIQITPRFNATNVALTNEGKVVYGNLKDEWNENSNDNWLTGVSEWEDIVSLSYDVSRFGFGGLQNAIIAGVKSDGSVEYVSTGELNDISSFIISLKNIRELSVHVEFNGDVSVVAIDKSGTLFVLMDGVTNTYNTSAIDAQPTYFYTNEEFGCFIISNDYVLSLLNNNKAIIEDAVYLNKHFVITRSGTIYSLYDMKDNLPLDTKAKTQVKDVWTER